MVEAEADAYAALGNWYEGEFDHLIGETRPGGAVGLREFVEVNDGPDNYRRVMLFTLSPVFPAEWRLAAYRSYLPDELPQVLGAWMSHLEAVREGAHRAYLRAWYRYASSRQLAVEWSALRERALGTRGRSNAWAGRAELVDVRERILARPVPEVAPVPYWDAPLPEDGTAPDFGGLVALAREWNYRVPRNQRVRVTDPESFDEFLRGALESEGLADLLGWVRRSCDEGFGLLLDW
ncbi:hypothetical protein [Actinomadura vinacea]|uniref:hypothetical protein n=1 Tax=Actinomadura vinacea TaxID=115336 RepID=UPI0031DECB09